MIHKPSLISSNKFKNNSWKSSIPSLFELIISGYKKQTITRCMYLSLHSSKSALLDLFFPC